MKKKIVILGAGESGTGAAILAQAKGFDTFVSDFSAIKNNYKIELDKRGIAWEELQHTEDLILSADEVIKSPGIPDKAPIIQKILQKGIPILSEIEFAGRYTDAKMICITGSNGKTTTTMLLFHILSQAGLKVGLAGNVGKSLAWQVAECPCAAYVLELSSFQLDNMYDFKADIAILLNITPDHLDRYNYEMQNYVNAKLRILQNQTQAEAFIFWNDDPIVAAELAKQTPQATCYPFAEIQTTATKAFCKDESLTLAFDNVHFSIDRTDLALSGKHNLYNAMAASIASKLVGIDDVQLKAALMSFSGVEHRLEKAGDIQGVCYINDSKATNVNSCWYALQSMTRPLVLILGGIDKGNDYTEIESLVEEKVHTLICLGTDNSKLHAFFDGKVSVITDANSMEEAVRQAASYAQKGDAVLLSPCCASFDLFNSYEDRGRQFKQCVKNLV